VLLKRFYASKSTSEESIQEVKTMTDTIDSKVTEIPAHSPSPGNRIDLMAGNLDQSQLHALDSYHIGEYQILNERKGKAPISTHTSVDGAIEGLKHPAARILRLTQIASEDYISVAHIAHSLYKKM